MGGSSGQTTKTEPWGPQQDSLKKIFNEANRLYNRQTERGPWAGSLYAPEDPRTGAARDSWYEMNRQNVGYMNPAVDFSYNNINRAQTQGQGWLDEAAGTRGNYDNASNWAVQGTGWNPLDSATGFSNETLKGPSQPLANILQGGQPTGWSMLDSIIKGGQNTGYGALDNILKGGQSTGNQQLDAILKGGQKTGNSVLDALASGQAPGGVLGQTLAGDFMDPNSALVQNYLNAATRPVEENLLRNQLPGLDSQAILSGAYGGSANAVQRGQAIGDTNQAIADTRANYLYQNQQAERDRQQQVGLTERQNQINSANNERAMQFQGLSNERGMQFQGLTNERGLTANALQNERNNQFSGLTNERSIEAANFQQRQNLLQQDRALQLQTMLQKYGMDSSNMFNAAAMEQGRNQMLAGMGTDSYNRGFQSAASLPSFFQAAQLPYQNMSQIGDMFTNSSQRELDNAKGMWDLQNNFNWDTLGQLQAMINGNYGMNSSMSGGGGGRLAGGAGGALAGASAGSGLAAAGVTAGLGAAAPWALPLILALAGGGAGYLASG